MLAAFLVRSRAQFQVFLTSAFSAMIEKYTRAQRYPNPDGSEHKSFTVPPKITSAARLDSALKPRAHVLVLSFSSAGLARPMMLQKPVLVPVLVDSDNMLMRVVVMSGISGVTTTTTRKFDTLMHSFT